MLHLHVQMMHYLLTLEEQLSTHACMENVHNDDEGHISSLIFLRL